MHGLGIQYASLLRYLELNKFDTSFYQVIVQKPDLDSCGYDFINIFKQRQNGRHFPDDIFKGAFVNKNIWISINISLKFIPKGPICNIPSLVKIMAWHWLGNKPLFEPMVVSLPIHTCVARSQWVKALSHEQNHNHFCRHFQMHYLICMLVQISHCVPKTYISIILSL